MTEENLNNANDILNQIKTLEKEISTLSDMERNTRIDKEFTHRLVLRKLLRIPRKKNFKNYWSSQDLDSVNSIILFDADEIKVLVDFKKEKVEKLKQKLNEL